MTTKINSYTISDKVVRNMKDMIRESDSIHENLGGLLIKNEKGELSLSRRDYGPPFDFVGNYHTQHNEKEPIPDLSELQIMCTESYFIHCRGANNKISCYKRKPDTVLDCNGIITMEDSEKWMNIKSDEEGKKLIEEEKERSKNIISKHFDVTNM